MLFRSVRTGDREERDALTALMQSGIVLDERTGREFYTGYAYRTLYDWDLYFEAILQLELGWRSEYVIHGIQLFLDQMEESGFIPRSYATGENQLGEEKEEMIKPFLAQTAILTLRGRVR